MKGKIYNVQLRRKREGKTDYNKRRKLLLSGKPRLVIRRFLKNMIGQIIEYRPNGDKVLFCVSSRNLEKFGWKVNKGNVPAAYLTGFLLGTKAKGRIKEAIADLGLSYTIKGSREFAFLKGVVDAGLAVGHSKTIFPSEERIKGGHIVKYAGILKKDQKKFEQRFSDYLKKGVDPENLTKLFDEVKSNISKVK